MEGLGKVTVAGYGDLTDLYQSSPLATDHAMRNPMSDQRRV